MILSISEAGKQVQQLLTAYPGLSITNSTSSLLQINGSIYVFRTALNFTVQKSYSVEILVPIGVDAFPTIRETNNLLDPNYPHRYIQDGGLCLETDTAIRFHFIDGFDLVAWMDEFVEPYFFSYEYYMRYGEFPFGERPHYIEGIFYTYQEFFHTKNLQETAAMLAYASDHNYRGHSPCPCSSGKKLRSCHGPYLLPLMTDDRKKAIITADVSYLRKELLSLEQSKTNTRKAK